MAGITDRAFRSICIDNGAFFTYTEMVSCEGIVRENKKTTDLLMNAENEKVYGIQIFASSPEVAGNSIKKILKLKYNPFLIDLNCGCPVKKVVKTGAGSALLNKPEFIKEIIKALKNETDIPVTLKIRSGWDSGTINFLKTSEMAVEGGADMICLHPRTRSQGYSGKADWKHIELLKRRVPIPVIGSGDLYSPGDACNMLRDTKCDGVMFARGAVGNPFIFSDTRDFFTDELHESSPKVNIEKIISTAEKQILLSRKYKGELLAQREMKKHLCAYTKGLPGSAELRNKIVHVNRTDDYFAIFKEYVSSVSFS